jgi:hypothetical protein
MMYDVPVWRCIIKILRSLFFAASLPLHFAGFVGPLSLKPGRYSSEHTNIAIIEPNFRAAEWRHSISSTIKILRSLLFAASLPLHIPLFVGPVSLRPVSYSSGYEHSNNRA